MRRVTTTLSVALMLLVLLVTAGPAAAQDRATANTDPINIDECFDFGSGEFFCIKNKGHYHTTVQPDGDIIVHVNTKFEYTYNYFGVEGSGSGTNQYQFHTREGAPQVEVFNSKFEFAFDDVTCQGHVGYVYANGELRADRFDIDCN